MRMTPEQQEKAYQFGCKLLQKARKKKDYVDLQLLFSNLSGFKDAGQLEEQCVTAIKKIKRKNTALLVCSLLISMLVIVVAAGAMYLTSPVSKYAFEENEDGIVITGLKKNLLEKDGTVVIIPEKIDEDSVVRIEALASET